MKAKNDVLHIDPNIQKVWFEFGKYMKKWYWEEYPEVALKKNKKGYKIVKTGRILKSFDSSKMVGWEAIKRAERFCKKNPLVKMISVDDSVFAGSTLILIPHPKMGITVIFIPQCTENRNEFFLYPSHYNDLIKTLTSMKKVIKG